MGVGRGSHLAKPAPWGAGRIPHALGHALDRFCVGCTLLFLLVTALACLAVTATMPHYTYAIDLNFAAGPFVALGAALFVAVVRSGRFQRWLDGMDARRLMHVLTLYIAVVGLGWVTMANVWPEWDSKEVLFMARDMLARQQLSPDSYASRFQHQVPLAALLAILTWVFGEASYQAFELLNVASVIAVAYALQHLSKSLFDDERTHKLTALLTFPFLPLVFYCTFMYGNLVSLPLCIEALALQCACFRDGGLRRGLGAIALACAATLLKSSMVVVLAGMLVAWAVHGLMERSLRSLGLVALALAAHLACGAGSSALAHATLGLESQNAMPKIVWVAMGLRGGVAPGAYNPGWYSPEWMGSWPGEAYDVETIRRDSRASIAASLDQFAHRPLYALYYFSVKYCTEWCQPDFESLLASNWVYTSYDDVPPMSERPMSIPLHSIYYGMANRALEGMLDCYQFVLVLGALVCAWHERTRGVRALTPLLVGAGTGLLYLFWEAQSQYVMHAYVFMVPYAAYALRVMAGSRQGRPQHGGTPPRVPPRGATSSGGRTT